MWEREALDLPACWREMGEGVGELLKHRRGIQMSEAYGETEQETFVMCWWVKHWCR